ncbi:MAG: hypothetical protein Phog2KO_12830 [Phototrophicaceae bacterium]
MTIVGAGGIGKTRFATALSQSVKDKLTDGVIFVDLQAVDKTEQVIVAIGDALSLETFGTDSLMAELIAYLQGKSLLLFLDNFEHLLGAVSTIQAILSATVGIKFLVTTREILRLREEYVYTLNGLSLPPLSTSNNQLADYSAVQLFIARAQQVRHDVTLDLNCIAEICRLLDGSPLAIELAAVWVRVLEPNTILKEIIACAGFLETDMQGVPERQRSMRAVFDGSIKLLTAVEKQALLRLAIFHGSFNYEAAIDVVETDLATLMALTNKSFLSVSANARYKIHNVIRQFALEALETDQTSYYHTIDRYNVYYVNKALEYSNMLRCSQQIDALDLMQADIQNMRASWSWAVKMAVNEHIENYIFALTLYYQMKSHTQDGLDLLTISPADFVKLSRQTQSLIQLFRGCMLIIRLQNVDGVAVMWDALQQLEQYPIWLGLALTPAMNQPELFATRYKSLISLVNERLAETDDVWEQAWLLKAYGESQFVSHQYDTAVEAFRQSVSLFKQAGDQWGLTWAYGNLGQSLIELGQVEEAELIYQQSIVICQAIGDVAGWIDVLNKRALLALTQGNHRATESILIQALQIATDNRIALSILTYLINIFVQLHIKQNQALIAIEILTMLSLDSIVQQGWRKPELDELDEQLEQLKQQVSHSDFVTHTARGRALSLRIFVDELLQKHTQEDNRYVAKTSALIEPLTDREQQILGLIVAGKTNREIADTLTVAIGTVKTHAHNLYSKLGVKNRTQATSRAYDLNLV